MTRKNVVERENKSVSLSASDWVLIISALKAQEHAIKDSETTPGLFSQPRLVYKELYMDILSQIAD